MTHGEILRPLSAQACPEIRVPARLLSHAEQRSPGSHFAGMPYAKEDAFWQLSPTAITRQCPQNPTLPLAKFCPVLSTPALVGITRHFL